MTPRRPPPDVPYRHSLGYIIASLLMGEFIFGAATYSNYVNGSAWMWLWGVVCVMALLLIIWRLLWLEANGWWIHRTMTVPQVPAQFGGFGWKATFDHEGVTASGGAMGGSFVSARKFAYSDIRRIESAGRNGLLIVAAGQVPLSLGVMDDEEKMRIIALLAFYSPQAKFQGALAAMRDGWQPRL